jgi:hypothetical protein
MKRIFLSAAALFSLCHSFAQVKDSSGFASRKLKLEEVNFVSSYYHQNGNNSPVTGGIGTQKLSDFANVLDVRLIKFDRKLRKNSFDLEVGIDHYSSASSDKIDLKANSSASYSDTRVYPSVSWTRENEKKGSSVGIGLSSSTEFDYQSFGANLNFSRKTKNRNGEFSAKLQAYVDQVKLVLPVELRTGGGGGDDDDDYRTKGRNSFSGSLSYSQIVNKELQVAIVTDAVYQTGYLSMPFYRVYFKDGSVQKETLPDTRFKLPLGVRANYFAGDKLIIRSFYRFYRDSWGLTAHTASIELPVKLNAFLSISPFYRFYSQQGVKYFAPYGQHTAQDEFYTSNYDLSTFNSHFVGLGIRTAPPKGVFNNRHINMLEIRYGYYKKNIDMNAQSLTLHVKFK